jgi:hypothetical protein
LLGRKEIEKGRGLDEGIGIMRCFYHREKDAVGTCKSCGKGLCPECAIDLVKGLACRGRCETDAKAVIALIDSNINISPVTTSMVQVGKSARVGAAVFMFVCGLIFMGLGLFVDRLGFIAALGGCFMAYGIFLFWSASRVTALRKRIEQDETIRS